MSGAIRQVWFRKRPLSSGSVSAPSMRCSSAETALPSGWTPWIGLIELPRVSQQHQIRRRPLTPRACWRVTSGRPRRRRGNPLRSRTCPVPTARRCRQPVALPRRGPCGPRRVCPKSYRSACRPFRPSPFLTFWIPRTGRHFSLATSHTLSSRFEMTLWECPVTPTRRPAASNLRDDSRPRVGLAAARRPPGSPARSGSSEDARLGASSEAAPRSVIGAPGGRAPPVNFGRARRSRSSAARRMLSGGKPVVPDLFRELEETFLQRLVPDVLERHERLRMRSGGVGLSSAGQWFRPSRPTRPPFRGPSSPLFVFGSFGAAAPDFDFVLLRREPVAVLRETPALVVRAFVAQIAQSRPIFDQFVPVHTAAVEVTPTTWICPRADGIRANARGAAGRGVRRSIPLRSRADRRE